jgi:protein CpxP
MKRLTFSAVITAVLGVAAYSVADAQSTRRAAAFEPTGAFQAAGPPPGPARGFGPRGGGAMFALRGIELTDEQKAQIKAIHDEARQAAAAADPAAPANRAEGRQGRGPRGGGPEAALNRELQAELFADTPDTGKIEALQQQLAQAHAARLAQQIAVEQKIAQVLTAEQRAQIRERLAEGRRPSDRRP